MGLCRKQPEELPGQNRAQKALVLGTRLADDVCRMTFVWGPSDIALKTLFASAVDLAHQHIEPYTTEKDPRYPSKTDIFFHTATSAVLAASLSGITQFFPNAGAYVQKPVGDSELANEMVKGGVTLSAIGGVVSVAKGRLFRPPTVTEESTDDHDLGHKKHAVRHLCDYGLTLTVGEVFVMFVAPVGITYPAVVTSLQAGRELVRFLTKPDPFSGLRDDKSQDPVAQINILVPTSHSVATMLPQPSRYEQFISACSTTKKFGSNLLFKTRLVATGIAGVVSVPLAKVACDALSEGCSVGNPAQVAARATATAVALGGFWGARKLLSAGTGYFKRRYADYADGQQLRDAAQERAEYALQINQSRAEMREHREKNAAANVNLPELPSALRSLGKS